jgi:Spy/CpxP family protein refolding chaperone
MKKHLLSGVCLLALVAVQPSSLLGSPQASASQTSIPSPNEVVAMMSSKLSLTDDQKEKITPIIAERQQKMKALMADTSMRKMKRAREAKSIMGDGDKKIEAVLTDEQKPKYEQMQAEMREKMKERRNGN